MAKQGHCHLDPELMNLDGGIFSAGQHVHRSIHWKDWTTGLEPDEPADGAAEIPSLMPIDLTQFIVAPPAEPAPVVVPASAERGDGPTPSRRRRRRRLSRWVALGAAGVLLLVGLAAASQLRRKPLPTPRIAVPGAAAELPAPQGQSVAQPLSPAPSASPEPSEPEGANASKATHAVTDPTPDNASSEDAPAFETGHDTPQGRDAPQAAPEPSAAPQAAPEPSAAPQKFSHVTAAVAIGKAVRATGGCGAPDGARAVPVRVVFAPDGRVSTASVQGGPLLGTAAGSCVATALYSARIPPFEGSSVSIVTTVRAR
jgi:hypothetical protein